MKDLLKKENCNKTHCKSCIFHPNFEIRINLSEERINEIVEYLVTFKSSHICHNTNKTCFGALELQAKILRYSSVDEFLNDAKSILNL